MLYHGFFIKITPASKIKRTDDNGSSVICDGFSIDIFENEQRDFPINSFTAAVGFEILGNTVHDAEGFAMDVVDSEEKVFLRNNIEN